MPGDVESPGIFATKESNTMVTPFVNPDAPVDLEMVDFVRQIKSVSAELAVWAENQIRQGRSLGAIKEQLRHAMRVVTPLREAVEPPADNVTQIEQEFNFVWAQNNPELFAQALREFQRKTPITHWRHRIDLSREGFLTLYAYRRPKPFGSVRDYLAVDKLYLREIGYVA